MRRDTLVGRACGFRSDRIKAVCPCMWRTKDRRVLAGTFGWDRTMDGDGGGRGLLGIHERVSAYGGSVTVESTGPGFSLSLRMPLVDSPSPPDPAT